MTSKKKIAIIIPVYNEGKRIITLINELEKVPFLVVVVDDGSTDTTHLQLIKKNITVLRHKVNQGKSKGSALKTGCEYALNQLKCGAVIFMDGDGQHLVTDLPKFIEKLNKGYDFVIGTRNFNLNVPTVRYLGNKLASLLISILFGRYVSDLLCGYRAMTKKAYRELRWESIGYGVETEMIVNLARTNLKWCEVPVTVLYHNKMKGVSLLDSFGIFYDVVKWKLSR